MINRFPNAERISPPNSSLPQNVLPYPLIIFYSSTIDRASHPCSRFFVPWLVGRAGNHGSQNGQWNDPLRGRCKGIHARNVFTSWRNHLDYGSIVGERGTALKKHEQGGDCRFHGIRGIRWRRHCLLALILQSRCWISMGVCILLRFLGNLFLRNRSSGRRSWGLFWGIISLEWLSVVSACVRNYGRGTYMRYIYFIWWVLICRKRTLLLIPLRCRYWKISTPRISQLSSKQHSRSWRSRNKKPRRQRSLTPLKRAYYSENDSSISHPTQRQPENVVPHWKYVETYYPNGLPRWTWVKRRPMLSVPEFKESYPFLCHRDRWYPSIPRKL